MSMGLLLLACLAAAGQAEDPPGVISGVVVNLGRERAPAAGVEVALRTVVDGDFLLVAETVADDRGRFRFEGLPVGDECVYVAGANHGEVHYPGPRLRLLERQPKANVEIGVYDAVSYPSPLVIRRHNIRLRSERAAIHVTEEILIENPTKVTFVGQPPPGGPEPVTLELSIPSNFERTTFQTEFFGRRFALIGGKLVTGIPWTPGSRELKFQYILPNDEQVFRWRRGVDLPCDALEVCVENARAEEVVCNLAATRSQQPGEVRFAMRDQSLAPGDVVQVELGSQPVSRVASARWLALGGLVGLIGGVGLVIAYRRRKAAAQIRTAINLGKPSRRKSTRRQAA